MGINKEHKNVENVALNILQRANLFYCVRAETRGGSICGGPSVSDNHGNINEGGWLTK